MNNELFFKRLEDEDMLVDSIHSIGWGFWPSKGGGYFDEHTLRILADEIERRNKPFWDEYERYCIEQDQKFGGIMHVHDENTFSEVPH